MHIGECLRGHPGVFDLKRRPWVLPDAAAPATVAAVVERCPSGALLYRRLDGAADEEQAQTTVLPIRDGPLLVRGDITVTLEDGSVERLPRASLCRCGQSQHKPFCDNQHLKIGFRAPGQPFKIHLSAVRPQLNSPLEKARDPRRQG